MATSSLPAIAPSASFALGSTGANVTIGGSIDVQSEHSTAYGVVAESGGNVSVSIGGNVYVNSAYGDTFGIFTESAGSYVDRRYRQMSSPPRRTARPSA